MTAKGDFTITGSNKISLLRKFNNNLTSSALKEPRLLHLWCSGVLGENGGIQRFNNFFVQSLLRLYGSCRLKVFIKNENAHFVPKENSQLRYYGFGGIPSCVRTLSFAFRIFVSALFDRPDLIIACHINFVMAAWILQKIVGVKYIVIVHGIEVKKLSHLMRCGLKDGSLIFAVSHMTRDKLIKKNWVSPERIKILPNTFDETRFMIKPKPQNLLRKFKLEPEAPVLLTVGRLCKKEQYKGHESVFFAMAQLLRKIPNLHYVIVGEGNDSARLIQLAKKLDIEKNVTFAGFVPENELPDYYNLCDLFIMPSTEEGFGIVYLEALASGKPVIAGNVDGARDPLRDGALGILVDPKDEQQITGAIIAILEKSHSNQSLFKPETLRSQAIEHFGFERYQEILRDFLLPYLKCSEKLKNN